MTDKKKLDDSQLEEIAGGAVEAGLSYDLDVEGGGSAGVDGAVRRPEVGETNPGGHVETDTTGGTGDGSNEAFN